MGIVDRFQRFKLKIIECSQPNEFLCVRLEDKNAEANADG